MSTPSKEARAAMLKWLESYVTQYPAPNDLPTVEEAFTAGYDASIPKWIKVEERMPAPMALVLAYDGALMFVSYRNPDMKWASAGGTLFCNSVTHWMPLLEPPKV